MHILHCYIQVEVKYYNCDDHREGGEAGVSNIDVESFKSQVSTNTLGAAVKTLKIIR